MELDPDEYALYLRLRKPQVPPPKGFVHIDEWLEYIKEALEWTPVTAADRPLGSVLHP